MVIDQCDRSRDVMLSNLGMMLDQSGPNQIRNGLGAVCIPLLLCHGIELRHQIGHHGETESAHTIYFHSVTSLEFCNTMDTLCQPDIFTWQQYPNIVIFGFP